MNRKKRDDSKNKIEQNNPHYEDHGNQIIKLN